MRRLILFAKRARPGRVKTRLTPPLTPAQAVRLYRGFVADGLEFLRSIRDPHCLVERCTDRLWPSPFRHDVPLTLQCRGDLGARMLDAVRRACDEGSTATVILGADAPTLPRAMVDDAFIALQQGADAVITPADDGGYVLLGLRRPSAGLFHTVPWGESGVLAATRAAAARERLRLVETASWYDIDRIRDLARLRQELQTPEGALRAPHTRKALDVVWTPEIGSC